MKILRSDELNSRVCVVVGTRPGIIKQAPTIRALQHLNVPHFVLHTGQHYSFEMDRAFFQDLDLPEPSHRVMGGAEGSRHGQQTARMLEGIERVLLKERPRIVLVIGDANTNLAAALAARKLQIRVGHIEAGLRSRDWRMPEEHNRVMMDHISEYLFAPTDDARANLTVESVRGRIHVTGNPIVDAVEENLGAARKRSGVMSRLDVKEGEYILFTSHREENVDARDRLLGLIDGIESLVRATELQLIFPVHPRTRRRIEQFGLAGRMASIKDLVIIDPVGYLDFLLLLANARLVVSDSGGVQEESCILRVPCVTVRDTTERPETIRVGANQVAGVDPDRIERCALQMLAVERQWPNPYGDGRAGCHIAQIVAEALSEPSPVQ